jgi:magnesium transporter
MTAAVPRAGPDETVASALSVLARERFDEASHVYLVGDGGVLAGQVPIETLLGAGPEVRLDTLCGHPPLEVRPDDDGELAALVAVEQCEADVAVVDGQRRLLGAIPIGRLLALLHEEHVDDMLRLSGIGASHPGPQERRELLAALRARLPWLILGLAGGCLASAVVGLFKGAIEREITLAFFLPLVVYMADAIGTQTETVLIRALAYRRAELLHQLTHEATIGLLIGAIIGVVAALALLAAGSPRGVALAVGLSLVATSIEATVLATILPWGLARLGVDPALASGPIATVLQDVLSVLVYLGIATLVLAS